MSLQSHSCYLVSLVANRVSQHIELHLWKWGVCCWFNIYNGLKIILCKNCEIEACQTAIPSGCKTEHSWMSIKHFCWVNQWNFLILAACWHGYLKDTLFPKVCCSCICSVHLLGECSKLRVHLLFLTCFCVAEGVLLLLGMICVKRFLSMLL